MGFATGLLNTMVKKAVSLTFLPTESERRNFPVPLEPYAKVWIVPTSKAKTGEKAEFTQRK
uniref:Uncharacterized protein n=1 Tax=Candidatus Kentrum sp. DK TaxID=2126562 RepID=A0A450S605_9GAMM|nr:MAG: hypothetical protein BECKDK2373B_GA0170837_101644 [Candidatus Kentron sp. DK]VFJ66941.1 MAG: hypothetical protein BECKDK2373C_GA0170839_11572 [Candidatus Kentron sp. DK]